MAPDHLDEFEDLDLDELSERLVQTLLEPLDDEDFEAEVDELVDWLEEERFGMLGLHLGGNDPELFEELADAGVDPRALLAYYVGLLVELFDAFGGQLGWDTLLLALKVSYSEDLLHDRWVLALEPRHPSRAALRTLTSAWRDLAELEIADVLALFDRALLESLEDFSEGLHPYVDASDDEQVWGRIGGVHSSIQRRLRG